MELQQLRYFREVAEREHVTRAADSLFVSQSAISRALTQLEEELGVPLFYRQGRAVVLSPYGRSFLEHVVRALNVLETGKRVLGERSGAETGEGSERGDRRTGERDTPRIPVHARVRWRSARKVPRIRGGEGFRRVSHRPRPARTRRDHRRRRRGRYP